MFTLEGTNYLTTTEAAEILNLKKYTMRRWCNRGIIRTIKIGGRTYIAEPELAELVKTNKEG